MFYTIVDNIISPCTENDILSYCKTKKFLGLDIETTKKENVKETLYFKGGLDPLLSNVIMLQIGDLDRQFIIDTRKASISFLLPVLNSKDICFIGHNLKFEAKHLSYSYGIELNDIYDTQVAEQIICCGLRKPKGYYALKNLSLKYLGIEMDKTTRKEFLYITTENFTNEQMLYGANDIIAPIRIRECQIKEIKEINSRFNINLFNCLKLEFAFTLVLANMELNGLLLDVEKWLSVYNDKLIKYKAVKAEIDNYVIKNYLDTKFVNKQLDFFSSDLTCNIDWQSSKQVVEFLVYLKICPKAKSKSTKKITFTAGAKDLAKLLSIKDRKKIYIEEAEEITSINSFLINYLKFKKLEQSCTTFGKAFIKYLHPISKRLHSTYIQILKTGRISSTKPNNQNYPSSYEYRSCFIPREDFVLISSDFSSQESRVLADIANETEMIKFFEEGQGDIHSHTATKMFRIIYKDENFVCDPKKNVEERQKAKPLNFKIVYGGSAYSLKDDLGVNEKEAQKFIDIYFESYPNVLKYFIKQEKECLKNGIIINNSFSYRICWLDNFEQLEKLKKENWRKYKYLYDIFKRKAYNTPIQGTAGDQTKLSAILLRKYIRDHNLQDKVYIVNLIHDEILLEVHNSISEDIRQEIEKIMILAAETVCKKVRMACKAEAANYWKH